MKRYKHLIVFLGIFLIFIAGCSKDINNKGNRIIVQKRVGENKYVQFKEINDVKKVLKIKNMLDNVDWENAQVSMVYPPNYKFHYENRNEQNKLNGLIYSLWISPGKNTVELVIEGESKYGQLNKSKSVELFETITGERLYDKE